MNRLPLRARAALRLLRLLVGTLSLVLLPVGRSAAAPTELAIEDMCPFSREGLVEDAINTRMGGAEPGMKQYGFRRVEPLRVVLKRHADEAGLKSAKP